MFNKETRDAVVEGVKRAQIYRESTVNIMESYLEQISSCAERGYILDIKPILVLNDIRSILSESEVEKIDTLVHKCLLSLSSVSDSDLEIYLEAQNTIRAIKEIWK